MGLSSIVFLLFFTVIVLPTFAGVFFIKRATTRKKGWIILSIPAIFLCAGAVGIFLLFYQTTPNALQLSLEKDERGYVLEGN
ncbi:hypothetical protein [Alkalihalobacillus sp. AL-G]|uniref:hypothetical protein n=1 Tax=Alkalihalobacillus sp. AL-G TaxID=2926399 RepID=UPI00272BAD96|nr:hypothetical protein [Alkalihalobacillus sp. AL-G]WLD94217.1 hypothetical protein MOJ78_04810 [Alkalihalobacillus sp. AL-G]